MSCQRHRDVLSDMAAGAAAPAGVEVHLASCAACCAELARLRQALALADDELARQLVVEPSPDFVARIRGAAAASAAAQSGWRLGWGNVVTAAAAAVIVATAFLAQRAERPDAPPTVVDRALTHEVPPAPPAPDPAPETRYLRSVESRPSTLAPSRNEPAREPEVLVQPEEAEALIRLAAHLRRSSVSPESLLVADLTAPLAEPEVRAIQPIEFVPLDAAENGGAERKGDHP